LIPHGLGPFLDRRILRRWEPVNSQHDFHSCSRRELGETEVEDPSCDTHLGLRVRRDMEDRAAVMGLLQNVVPGGDFSGVPKMPGQRAHGSLPPVDRWQEFPVLALRVIWAGAPLRADLSAGQAPYSGTRGCPGQGAGTWGDCQGCKTPERVQRCETRCLQAV